MPNLNIRIPQGELDAYRASLRAGETLSARLRQDMKRSIADRARKRKSDPSPGVVVPETEAVPATSC